MPASGRPWTREEQLIVLRYYLQTEHGRLHRHNPEIIAIAERLGRTTNSIAMKGSNYVALGPKITETGRVGLTKTTQSDRDTWAFTQESIGAFEQESAEAANSAGLDPVTLAPVSPTDPKPDQAALAELQITDAVTDAVRSVVVHWKQAFFHKTVLAAYRESYAIEGINVPELLNASHIIPWNAKLSSRLEPTNGIALNALHDRAFGRGLISFTNDLRVIVSSTLSREPMSELHRSMLTRLDGRQAQLPLRFQPDPVALDYHRDRVFEKVPS